MSNINNRILSLSFMSLVAFGIYPKLYAQSEHYSPEFFEFINFPKDYFYHNENHILVTVIDSVVQPLPNIELINTFNHTELKTHKKDLDDPNYIHGTAMASIIGAKLDSYEGKPFVGIFPGIPIINRAVIPRYNHETSFLNAIQAADLKGDEFILNISAADIGTKNATEWNELLKEIGKKDKILVIAAVGNDARNLNNISPSKQFWPAAYKPRKKEFIDSDPVIRVAALSFKTGKPRIYESAMGTGSRFGKGRVDIGAPGYNIPYLTPSSELKVGNGTSEATAIVSSIIAVMRSCSANNSAKYFKDLILETADQYEHLKDKITEGRVLNAGKAIEKACHRVRHRKMKELIESKRNLMTSDETQPAIPHNEFKRKVNWQK
ncbi:S8/S53 family peptidase [Fluviispira multicolorata]|nr:S8/S53 family peptidase [Fluviispira multicolorata]